jgi:hypothetical protein
MLHAVLGEGVVSLGAVYISVEEVLHVPKGNANRNILGKNHVCNHKTDKTKQNHPFHTAHILFPLQM